MDCCLWELTGALTTDLFSMSKQYTHVHKISGCNSYGSAISSEVFQIFSLGEVHLVGLRRGVCVSFLFLFFLVSVMTFSSNLTILPDLR